MPHWRCSVLALGLLAFVLGCGASPAPIKPIEEPPPPPPRNADAIAQQVVGAKIVVMIELDRLRDHGWAMRAASLGGWLRLFDGTGIDPRRDLDRAFLAVRNMKARRDSLLVAEHHAEPARVKAAVDQLIADSELPAATPAGWLEDSPVPSARVAVEGRVAVVVLVGPQLIAVGPERHARPAAPQLAASGGLPEPTGTEAILARVENPSESLRGRRIPRVPATMSTLTAALTVGADSAAMVHIEGPSSSAAQAQQDAVTLTRELDKATSVKLLIVRVRAFDPIHFRAQGTTVVGDRRFSARELGNLLDLASRFVR